MAFHFSHFYTKLKKFRCIAFVCTILFQYSILNLKSYTYTLLLCNKLRAKQKETVKYTDRERKRVYENIPVYLFKYERSNWTVHIKKYRNTMDSSYLQRRKMYKCDIQS